MRIDHYGEIGFRGLVDVVDGVGGVRMCVDRHIRDRDSGVDLRKGCHHLDGAQALVPVRRRHQEAGAIRGAPESSGSFSRRRPGGSPLPEVLLSPATLRPVLGAVLDAQVVDTEMGPADG
ncbi:LCP family protein [Streptomyces sp. NPDC001922]|uniref:LCP family glycopolymer transferase n=1 Tax=Streptomyces sp. NPDC001922 TaxID=3364624 RepID=UPI0036946AF4